MGIAKVARVMLGKGIDEKAIAELTGLSREEVKKL